MIQICDFNLKFLVESDVLVLNTQHIICAFSCTLWLNLNLNLNLKIVY